MELRFEADIKDLGVSSARYAYQDGKRNVVTGGNGGVACLPDRQRAC